MEDMGDEQYFRWWGWTWIMCVLLSWFIVVGVVTSVKWTLDKCAQHEQQKNRKGV